MNEKNFVQPKHGLICICPVLNPKSVYDKNSKKGVRWVLSTQCRPVFSKSTLFTIPFAFLEKLLHFQTKHSPFKITVKLIKVSQFLDFSCQTAPCPNFTNLFILYCKLRSKVAPVFSSLTNRLSSIPRSLVIQKNQYFSNPQYSMSVCLSVSVCLFCLSASANSKVMSKQTVYTRIRLLLMSSLILVDTVRQHLIIIYSEAKHP